MGALKRTGCLAFSFVCLGLLVGAILSYALPCYFELFRGAFAVRPICHSPLQRWISVEEPFVRYLPLDEVQPVPHEPIPLHPFMASNQGNNMHNDAYMSDASEAGGPLVLAPQVRSRTQGFGGYGTIAFDRAGRLVGVHSSGRTFQLELMDPDTLEELASFDLPPRPWYFLLQGVPPWKYIGAGMYFFLDEKDRAVVPTTQNTIQVIQTPEPGQRCALQAGARN